MTAAVIYAAKSTEDTHGSIPTQIEDCRTLADRNDWEIVGEFKDEAFSAFSGNRGPALDQAKALAIRTAAERGSCVLVAQDADRFARGAGDAPGAADHLGEIYFAMRRQGVALWSARSGELDLLRAALEGERSTDESARKSQATRAGLRRRKERGSPVGALPLGYRTDKTQDPPKRVIDPNAAPTVERIFDLIEAGHSPGEAARRLNAEGIRTKSSKRHPHGNEWTPRPVREIVRNDDYAGCNGYPAIIEPERWQRINDGYDGRDVVARQGRRGGRPPKTDDYLLRGLVFCADCGSPLYTRRQARGRVYLCSARRQCRGTCNAPTILAEPAEAHVLQHLHVFVGSVEDWLSEQVNVLSADQAARQVSVDREKAVLAKLDRKREKHFAEYDRLLEAGDPKASLALESVERVTQEQTAQQKLIAEAEAVLAEWTGPPDLDAAIDFYNEIVDLVRGRVRKARGADEMNRALRQVISGLWLRMDGTRLRAEFELRADSPPGRLDIGWLFKNLIPVGIEAKRIAFPDATTDRHTFV